MDNSYFSDNNFNCHCNSKEINSNCHNIGCGYCYKFLLGATGPSGEILNYADFYALMPPDNAAALTITPLAGGTNPVSAHLVILQIQ